MITAEEVVLPAQRDGTYLILDRIIQMLVYAVERSIRPITLGRKNWLFVDSDESAKDAAVYMTLIGSCSLLGIAPYKYFEYILPRLHGNMTEEEYKELLPYKAAKEIKKG